MTYYPDTIFHGSTGTVTGEKVRVDGFPGSARTRHTVSVTAVNLKGRVVFEGTLLDHPTDDDWFDIEYFDFETIGQETRGLAFQSKTVWFRARLDGVEKGYVRRLIVR